MRPFVCFLCFGCLLSIGVNAKEVLGDSNKTLWDGSNVLKRLAIVKQHLFAGTFYKMNPKRLISALESASIFAGLPKSSFDEPVDDTLTNIYENIKMITANLKDLSFDIVSNYNFSMMVGLKIGAASFLMRDFNTQKIQKWERPLEFLKGYDKHQIDEMVPLILDSFAWSVPADVAVKTHFNQRQFQATQSLLVQFFFQAYLLQYIRVGIENTENLNATIMEYIDNGRHNKTNLENLRNDFVRDYKQLKKILVKTSAHYKKSFFPGFSKDDIVRPVVDCIVNSYHQFCYLQNLSSSDNCNIAHYIVRNMTERFPWRNYAAIVSNTAVNQDNYAYFGFPNRTVVEQNYNGKTVLLFMSTKRSAANYEKFNAENGTQIISSQEINGSIDTLLNYAKYGNGYVQMAVFNDRVNPCFAVVKEKIGNQVDWERNGLKLGAYVVF